MKNASLSCSMNMINMIIWFIAEVSVTTSPRVCLVVRALGKKPRVAIFY